MEIYPKKNRKQPVGQKRQANPDHQIIGIAETGRENRPGRLPRIVINHHFDAGKKIQQSGTVVWSDPISPNAKSTPLSFREAFRSNQ